MSNAGGLPSDPSLNALLSDINADIDAEISARARLSETIEARIAWAIILKESAEGKAVGNASQSTFKSVAQEALLASEESSRFLLNPRRPRAPPPLQSSQPISRVPKKLPPSNIKQKASFLYIRSSALNHSTQDFSHLYLLKCPACGRTAFTSLQGLLNHARLSHSLEWGTHDECIRACAVPDNDIDISQGAEVGLGPSGVLAGLRTIFERAVGTSTNVLGFKTEPMDLQADAPQEVNPAQSQLNLTLGLHEESPALAPFLGKAPIRRQISVWDEDVDITSTQPEKHNQHRWKMPFAHRGFREELTKAPSQSPDSANIPVEDTSESHEDNVPDAVAPANQDSRFYFVARIVLADRSMWLSPGRRLPDAPEHTHKWMISVDAPSYAFHITSILKSVQVIPQTDDAALVTLPPPTTQPPFVVLGTSSVPFLAKVELTFTGTGRDGPKKLQQVVTLQHWVDIDPLHSEQIVLGQEQILDIELDKNTQLNPVQSTYLPITSKAHWAKSSSTNSQLPKPKRIDGYEQILLKLAKQFPLFVKEKPPPGVNQSYSYLLPTSIGQWNSFCLGRRKAIAWARSQAICNAYEDIRQSSSDDMQNLVKLSTADVWRWLSDKGMFPSVPDQEPLSEVMSVIKQEEVKQEEVQPTPSLFESDDRWCSVCGTCIPTTESDFQHHCPAISIPRSSRRSTIDIKKSLNAEIFQMKHQRQSPASSLQQGEVITATHPSLLLWVKEVAESSKLPAFPPSRDASFHLDAFGDSHRAVEKSLAPFGVLAFAVQSLVKELVESGVRVIEEGRNGATPSSQLQGHIQASADVVSRKRLLTPSHILSGMSAYDRGDDGDDPTRLAVKLSLSKLGVPLKSPHSSGGSGDEEVLVKMEE